MIRNPLPSRLPALTFFVLITLAAPRANAAGDQLSVAQTSQPATDATLALDQVNCLPNKPPTVTVTIMMAEPKVDESKSISQLQAMRTNDPYKSIPHYDTRPLGLTFFTPYLYANIPVTKKKMPNGMVCTYIQHVNVMLGYKDATIYVAKEFPNGTCSFDTVMLHESKHIEATRAHFEDYKDIIHKNVTNHIKSNYRLFHANPAYAEELLIEKAKAIIGPLAKQMFEANRERQQQVDTREEYENNNKACDGFIGRKMRNLRR